jgi:thiosulfate reductase cytochrome b subunit
MVEPETPGEPSAVSPAYRHPWPVRLTHWLNLFILLAMLGSGLQIFNAHPALYWGDRSDAERAWLALEARSDPRSGEPQGVTRIFGATFNTTGWLGFSSDVARGFPAWATIPTHQWLAMGRRWHLFFAWLLVVNALAYIGYSIASRHLTRDLTPNGGELRTLGRTVRRHFRLRHLRADSDQGYNPLQKLSYLAVVFLLGPFIVLTGLAMSPSLDASFHFLPEMFTGRQSARSIHFLLAFGFVLFTLVHVFMVLLVGPWRHVRAMITGYLPPRRESP